MPSGDAPGLPGPEKTRAPFWGALGDMAEWTGLEPATSGVTGQHSNQLNYHSAYHLPGGC